MSSQDTNPSGKMDKKKLFESAAKFRSDVYAFLCDEGMRQMQKSAEKGSKSRSDSPPGTDDQLRAVLQDIKPHILAIEKMLSDSEINKYRQRDIAVRSLSSEGKTDSGCSITSIESTGSEPENYTDLENLQQKHDSQGPKIPYKKPVQESGIPGSQLSSVKPSSIDSDVPEDTISICLNDACTKAGENEEQEERCKTVTQEENAQSQKSQNECSDEEKIGQSEIISDKPCEENAGKENVLEIKETEEACSNPTNDQYSEKNENRQMFLATEPNKSTSGGETNLSEC